jgi:type I restriction enzyme, S subunit
VNRWREVKLKDIVSLLGDGLHGTPKYDPSGDFFFINGNNLENGQIVIKSSTQRCSYNEYLKYKKNLNDRTILVSINGTLGNVAVYNNEKCILGKSACYFNVVDTVDKSFVKYVVTNGTFQTYIREYANGTTIQNVSLEVMRDYTFLLPTLSEQQAIAEVLSSLDDKIDLLHRNNRTLEQMAETLFRQWFVEEAESGWETDTLGHHLTALGGTTPDTSEPRYWNGSIAWTSPRDLSGSIAVFMNSTQRTITELGLSKIGSGLLPIGTVLLSSRAPIGYLSISNIPVAINQGYIACVCDKGISNWYIYCWIKDNMDLIVSSANGSTFLEISKSTFRSLEFVVPPKSKLKEFNELVEPWFKKILSNENQIRSLELLRDTLLPKLMNGEVRVYEQ